MRPPHPSLALAAAASFLAAGVARAQTGLLGQYFDSATPPALGAPADFTRTDARVDFTWTLDAPDGTTLVPDDVYSARWTGWVQLPSGGLWTFTTASNDGARLWLDGLLVIDDWSVHATQERSGTFAVPDGGWVPLRLEHFNQGGTAVMRLLFEGPGQPRGIVPTTALCPSGACVEAEGPSIDAGPDQFLVPGESLQLRPRLHGIKVSKEPSSLEVLWTRVSGPPATIDSRDELMPTVQADQAGVLQLRVKVTDPAAGTAVGGLRVYVFDDDSPAELVGEPRKWDKLALTFTHDQILSETGTPNPFLDLRLQVWFYHPQSGTLHLVPGFFAADGDAADTSALSGTKWRVNFTPDHAGRWFYLASFRTGPGVAIDLDRDAGTPLGFDNASGTFVAAPADPAAGGFVSAGRLEYVGAHHMRSAETHAWYLKNGTDSPENFFGYYEFDGTSDLGGTVNDLVTQGHQDGLHHFDAHVDDYVERGPHTWKNDRGRRILGAIDYLAASGVNSLYALTYNIDGGDGREVFPWANAFDKTRFDVSKLAQWELVVDHMMRAGVAWHVVTQETENDSALDGGALGVQRKLYFRELVARFAHAPALYWNLGEENDNSPDQRRAFADWLHLIDPYDHPVTLHNHSGDLSGSFGALLGTHLEVASVLGDLAATGPNTQELVDDSAAAGRPWVINYDEQGPPDDGVVPDAEDFWHDTVRTLALWPHLMAQGGGCEWYFGYAHPHSDLDCEDFRSRDNLWRVTLRALDFLRGHLPFQEMQHADALATGFSARTLALPGEFYAVYLPFGGATTLNLTGSSGSFRVSWFDARNGGNLVSGSVTQVTAPGLRSLGASPGPGDWVAFVRRAQNLTPTVDQVTVERAPSGSGDFAVLVHARDPNGPEDALTVRVEVFAPDGSSQGEFPAPWRGGDLYSLFSRDLPPFASGNWHVVTTVTDEAGAETSASTTFGVP